MHAFRMIIVAGIASGKIVITIENAVYKRIAFSCIITIIFGYIIDFMEADTALPPFGTNRYLGAAFAVNIT